MPEETQPQPQGNDKVSAAMDTIKTEMESAQKQAQETTDQKQFQEAVLTVLIAIHDRMEGTEASVKSLEFPTPKDFPTSIEISNLPDIPKPPKEVTVKNLDFTGISGGIDKLTNIITGFREGQKMTNALLFEILAALRDRPSESDSTTEKSSPGGVSIAKGRKTPRLLIETPTGTINGSNTEFYLSRAPLKDQFFLEKNTALQTPTDNYTITGNRISYVVAPQPGDSHKAYMLTT